MTTTYRNAHLHFLFPENWNLTETETDGIAQVSLESPQGCIWDLYRIPAAESSVEWISQLLEALAEQYDSFEQETIELEIGEQRFAGHEAYFYCLDLLITAHVLELPGDNQEQRVLMYQGESREFDAQLPVFHAITASLLSGDSQQRSADEAMNQ